VVLGGVEVIVAQNYGQNCALITVEDGAGVTYFQTTGTTYWRQVDGQPGSNHPIPIGPTSQGWLDYDPTRGGLVWTDTHRIMTVDGVTMVCAMQRGGTWVGQSPTASPDEAIGVCGGVPYGLGVIASGPLPHVAADDLIGFAVARTLPGARIQVTTGPPFPSVGDITAPEITAFGRQMGVGLFKVTTKTDDGYLSTAGPGHFEILTDGAPWLMCRDKTRPVIADLQSAPSVAEGRLLALFVVVGRDNYRLAQAFATRNRVPIIWYSDEFPFADAGVPRHGWWMVKGYPTATPDEIDRELTRVEAIQPRLMLAWPVYIQQPMTWSLRGVVAHQAPLADVVRRHPSVVLLGCFSGAGRDNGIGTYPVLAECYTRLLGASDGLPDLAGGPVPVPVPPDPEPLRPSIAAMRAALKG